MAQYKNQFIDIDPDTCTMQELEKAIEQMDLMSNYYESKQLAIKQFINSVYGATASKYFVGHNTEVAESITLQGQDLNHFSENCVNKYFRGIFQSKEEYNKIIYVPVSEYIEKYSLQNITEFYKKDENGYVLTELPCTKEELVNVNEIPEELKNKLSKCYVKTIFGPYLGITYEQAASIDLNKGRITEQHPLDWYANHAKNQLDPKENPFAYLGKNTYLVDDPTCSMTVAGDTDSIYVEYGRLTTQLNIHDFAKASRFVVDMWNYGNGPFMNKCYDEYAKKFNCDKNLENLELEKIADTAIMIAKKHYAMSECFLEPNIFLNPSEHEPLYKGLELIQRSTPIFARKCQDDFYKYILNWYCNHTEQPPFNILYEKIKKYKADFALQNPDSLCKAQNISDYDKFVADDNNSLALLEHIPIHVKAAATANYFLNKPENKKWKVKYNKIKSRDRVKFYYTTNEKYPVFGFLPDKYPAEYALPMDINMQFAKVVLEPINSVMEILGYEPLTSDLCFTTALF